VERLDERIAEAEKALKSLEEALAATKPTAIERDAAIMRFAFTFEAAWKAAQRYLAEREGVEVGSPKRCIRQSRSAGVLTDAETDRAILMADDRNLVVHTYREPLAVAIFARLPSHAIVIAAWLAAMRRQLS